MSDLESRIQTSYERLRVGSPVYLLRDEQTDYGELPNPDEVKQVFKAGVIQINAENKHGMSVVNWPGFSPPAEIKVESIFVVSPREVFKVGEIKDILRERTILPIPRPSKLERYIKSRSGAYGAILAAEMARVILERFSEDPRDSSGQLIKV